MNRDIIAEKVKSLRNQKKEEDLSKKKITDTGEQPNPIDTDPELKKPAKQVQ